MFILFMATVGILYLGYKAIMALPKGKEEPLTEDEIRWCFPELVFEDGEWKYDR